MGQRAPSIRPDRRRRRVRVLVLRPAALPLERLRRPRPVRARGLPGQGPVQRGDPARRRVRRAHLQRLRRQVKKIELEDEGDNRDLAVADDRDRRPLRADSRGHAGDAATEDAAGRDLRGADPGVPGRPERWRRTARCRRPRWPSRSSSTRSSAPSTRAPRPRSRPGCSRRAIATDRPRRRPLGRDRQPRAVRRGRQPPAPRARHPGRGACPQFVKNTGVVFGALSERQGQLRGLIQNSGTVFATTARRNRRPRGDLHRAAHLPRRVARDAEPARGRSRARPTR